MLFNQCREVILEEAPVIQFKNEGNDVEFVPKQAVELGIQLGGFGRKSGTGKLIQMLLAIPVELLYQFVLDCGNVLLLARPGGLLETKCMRVDRIGSIVRRDSHKHFSIVFLGVNSKPKCL
jgi:hypothetical protein